MSKTQQEEDGGGNSTPGLPAIPPVPPERLALVAIREVPGSADEGIEGVAEVYFSDSGQGVPGEDA